MKKILLALFFFIGIVNAQTFTPEKLDLKNPFKYTHQTSGDTLAQMVYLINAVSGITSSTNNYAEEHTTVAAADSVVFGFTTKYVTFVNDATTSDTLYVSPSPSFPATNTIKRIGGEGFTKPYGVTKLYFKVGATPQASKIIRIEAN